MIGMMDEKNRQIDRGSNIASYLTSNQYTNVSHHGQTDDDKDDDGDDDEDDDGDDDDVKD